MVTKVRGVPSRKAVIENQINLILLCMLSYNQKFYELSSKKKEYFK